MATASSPAGARFNLFGRARRAAAEFVSAKKNNSWWQALVLCKYGHKRALRRSNNTVAEHGHTVYLTWRLRFLNGRRTALFNYKLSAAVVPFKDKQATAK